MTGKKIIIFGVTVSLLTFSIANLSFAESEISAEKVENIEMDCQSIKQTLKRIQNLDKNARISIGGSYQTILTSFVTPLNVRLVKNNKSNTELSNIQNNLAEAREIFNRDYISYSQDFETLLNIDCKNEPQSFYRQLEKTRTSRKAVATSAKKVREIINSHIKEVEKLKNTFEAKNE